MKKNRTFTVILIVAILVFTGTVPTVFANHGNWTKDIRLTYTYGISVGPAIAVEGENVHIVYADNETGGKYQRFPWYVRSIDGGNVWSTPICFNNSSQTNIGSPRIAVYGDNVHVIWFDYSDVKLHYIKSSDNGDSWGPEKSISGLVYYYTSSWDIGVYENNLHVTYINSNNKVSYIHSNDNGITWSSPKILMSSVNDVIRLTLTVEGFNIHIAEDAKLIINGSPANDIYYTKSVDNGISWEKEININEVTGIDIFSSNPNIGVSGNNVHLIFRGQIPGTAQVYYTFSNDNGINWQNGGILSNTTGYVSNPTIAVRDSDIFIIWTYKGVYYLFSNDDGEFWTEDARVTNSSGSLPDLTISEDAVHFTWYCQVDWEIYYKRYSLVPPTISGDIDIDPDTLNLKSKGRWITAYIELSEGYDVNDINISSIILQNSVPVEFNPSGVGDHDNDGIPDLMVKFDRSEVEDILSEREMTLTLTGLLSNGTVFEGSDIIMVISPP